MINGIYAASMSVINKDLTLDVTKTIQHAETIIDQGCHGAAIFGSTGQAQLISISEKINLFNQLSTSKYKEKVYNWDRFKFFKRNYKFSECS
jgi:4-hydroxy-tetrahydrodipicolinate synthase